ncbi:MAG: SET domain-containing protein-lysine N-methyltransferase [Spirochaetales bacterium]
MAEASQIFYQAQEFFRAQGLVYLRRSRVAAPEVLAYDWADSPYAHSNRDEFDSLTSRYGDALRAGETAPLCLADAGAGIGWGVFASAPLLEGALVGEYSGVIQSLTDAPADAQVGGHFLSDYSWNYPDELPDGSAFEVNAFYEGNHLRYVNHSSKPNCAVDHTLVDGLFVTFFRVTEPIPVGGQLFVDYGDEYWSGGFRQVVDL